MQAAQPLAKDRSILRDGISGESSPVGRGSRIATVKKEVGYSHRALLSVRDLRIFCKAIDNHTIFCYNRLGGVFDEQAWLDPAYTPTE
jgi:hypothetical protein